MNDYVIRTEKTWHQTMQELADQMRMWGVTEWDVTKPKGARTERWYQTEADRTVELTYTKNSKAVNLVMGGQKRAVDNLRVLYLAVEAMRLNERRGISDVIASAYLQLEAPAEALDPYELLEIRPDTSLQVAEAAYKAKVRTIHPDRGGSVEEMAKLNNAIEAIRRTART